MLTFLFLAAQDPVAAVPAASALAQPAVITTASGLRFQVLEPGEGRRPGPDDAVRVTYEGRLADGTLFDSTPEPVGLLVSALIPGFTEALQLMNAGGRYRFRVPARLAYGARGVRGVVPANAELEFTVTLLAVGRPARR